MYLGAMEQEDDVFVFGFDFFEGVARRGAPTSVQVCTESIRNGGLSEVLVARFVTDARRLKWQSIEISK